MNLSTRFPIYIVSKGRAESRITSKHLTAMGCPHFVVVEPQEFDEYAKTHRESLGTIIALDMSYKERYELCDDLGLTKSTGSGPARNFAGDHSRSLGYSHHWVMDDNIRGFTRSNRSRRVLIDNPDIIRVMEDFVLRYANVAMSGPNYDSFIPDSTLQVFPPFRANVRVYSCNLIRNDVPFRWRGRYNEDSILSLDMLKAGWCTILFNAFLQRKIATQTLKGGNTTELYGNGTKDKSEMLARVHPDVVKTIKRYGRDHHYFNYGSLRENPLVRSGIDPVRRDYAI